jgi:phosphoribosylformylglycinamidine cyclo-ligase
VTDIVGDNESAYSRAGVDIDAGARATDLMAEAVRATYGKEVLAGIGAFGGLFDISALTRMRSPVLVASTDGVGTKTKVAAKFNRWDTIGRDLVNHCVNDILVQGATPLFFLDYVASSKLDPEQIATIVGGVAAACKNVKCALLGGETAEMPGVYQSGEVDLVGTIVGVVERDEIIDGAQIRAGDSILGLPSSGLHTNGYSLARRVFDDNPHLWDEFGVDMLAVHRPYLSDIRRAWDAGVSIHGMAHITGGGLIDNPPRIFPDGLGAVIRRDTWTVPPIFRAIQQHGDIRDAEMFCVFNMGIGMLVIVAASVAKQAADILGCPIIGEMVSGSGVEIV